MQQDMETGPGPGQLAQVVLYATGDGWIMTHHISVLEEADVETLLERLEWLER